jgi:hypothetical protein
MQPGDRIQITDTGFSNAGSTVTLSGNVMTVTDGALTTSFTISNLGPGRFATRDIFGGGLEIRLQQTAHNDFNGDGRSDILWRSDDGTVTDWLGQANGGFSQNWNNFHISNPGSNWQVAGTGDFNGDGRADILWRADDGTVTDWLGQANGSFSQNWNNFHSNPGSNWHVAGTGDFNGDGRADILWRADDGTVTDWLGQANGSFSENWNNFHISNPGSNWHVAGTGDFNGDGSEDILWRADDGTVTDWLGQPNGGFSQNWNSFHSNPGSNWHVAGTGDFNGDGIADILWRADDGTVTDWLGQTNGGFSENWTNFHHSNPGSNWHVVGIGDLNGDAVDDIVWRADDGTTTDWLGQTNGSFAENWNNYHNNPGANWHVQDPLL